VPPSFVGKKELPKNFATLKVNIDLFSDITLLFTSGDWETPLDIFLYALCEKLPVFCYT